MKLTHDLKTEIDKKSMVELLERVRNAPIGDSMFQGESGDYWLKRLSELRVTKGPAVWTAASKSICL